MAVEGAVRLRPPWVFASSFHFTTALDALRAFRGRSATVALALRAGAVRGDILQRILMRGPVHEAITSMHLRAAHDGAGQRTDPEGHPWHRCVPREDTLRDQPTEG